METYFLSKEITLAYVLYYIASFLNLELSCFRSKFGATKRCFGSELEAISDGSEPGASWRVVDVSGASEC
jgi:hypothetical protein